MGSTANGADDQCDSGYRRTLTNIMLTPAM